MAQTRTVFKAGVSATIYSNTQKLVKGNTVRDKFLVMADSVLFIDEANLPGGFLKIHAMTQNVDISFLKSATPSGSFLRDDGTWAIIGGGLPSQTGNGGKFLITNGSNTSWNSITANAISGTFLFNSGQGIDTVDTAGSDVLNIGTTSANIINYGNSSTQHNFYGTAIYESQVNTFVADKLITLNNGGAVGSGIGSGFEILEGGAITGYFKTNAARNGFSFKSPAIEYRADLNTDLLTADRAYSLPNASGTFLVASLADGQIPYGSAGSVIGSSNFVYSSGKLSMIRNTVGGLGYFQNDSYNLAGAAPIMVADRTGGFQIGIGYTNVASTAFFYVTSSGLYIDASYSNAFAPNNYGVFLPNTNLHVTGKTRLGDSNYTTGKTLEVAGTFLVMDKSYLGGAGTATSWLHLAAGTTAVAPLRLTSGPLLTTTEVGALEFLTDRLYFTRTTGSARQTLAYLSDIVATTPGGSDDSIQFKSGTNFAGSTRLAFTTTNFLKVDGSALFGMAVSNNPTAFVDVAPAVATRASLRIRSAASAPTTLNDGDIWYTGGVLWIRIGTNTRRFTVTV